MSAGGAYLDQLQDDGCVRADRDLRLTERHPLHLHRHSFELTRIGGKSTAGVIKDVVMMGGFKEVEFDFVANNPGLTLFHCHQQLHTDFGFVALFNYA
jgi:FtsP/CotA-like multicopper oxidase with cupredoxin domain